MRVNFVVLAVFLIIVLIMSIDSIHVLIELKVVRGKLCEKALNNGDVMILIVVKSFRYCFYYTR